MLPNWEVALVALTNLTLPDARKLCFDPQLWPFVQGPPMDLYRHLRDECACRAEWFFTHAPREVPDEQTHLVSDLEWEAAWAKAKTGLVANDERAQRALATIAEQSAFSHAFDATLAQAHKTLTDELALAAKYCAVGFPLPSVNDGCLRLICGVSAPFIVVSVVQYSLPPTKFHYVFREACWTNGRDTISIAKHGKAFAQWQKTKLSVAALVDLLGPEIDLGGGTHLFSKTKVGDLCYRYSRGALVLSFCDLEWEVTDDDFWMVLWGGSEVDSILSMNRLQEAVGLAEWVLARDCCFGVHELLLLFLPDCLARLVCAFYWCPEFPISETIAFDAPIDWNTVQLAQLLDDTTLV